jgi:hypothetical protein
VIWIELILGLFNYFKYSLYNEISFNMLSSEYKSSKKSGTKFRVRDFKFGQD